MFSGLLLKTQAFARRYGLAAAIIYLGLLLLVFGHHCGPQEEMGGPGCTSPDSRHYCGAHFPDPTAGHLCSICTSQRHQVGTLPVTGQRPVPLYRSALALSGQEPHFPRIAGSSRFTRGPPSC